MPHFNPVAFPSSFSNRTKGSLRSEYFKNTLDEGLGEMAQWWLRALALAEDTGSIPSIHVKAYNHWHLQFQEMECALLTSLGMHVVQMHALKK